MGEVGDPVVDQCYPDHANKDHAADDLQEGETEGFLGVHGRRPQPQTRGNLPENLSNDSSVCFSFASNQPMRELTTHVSGDRLFRCDGHTPDTCDSICDHPQRDAAQHGMGDDPEAALGSNTKPGAFEEVSRADSAISDSLQKRQKPIPLGDRLFLSVSIFYGGSLTASR